jgi:hypothetical protein
VGFGLLIVGGQRIVGWMAVTRLMSNGREISIY